jgi:hypothetical protein
MLVFRESDGCEERNDRGQLKAPALLDLRSVWEWDVQAEMCHGRCRPNRLASWRAQTRVSLAEGEVLGRKSSD